jgi:glycosyltransferase involved in cell wall biosynthesis
VPGPEERSAARRQLSLDDETPVVLFVGRLVEKKGLPLVLTVARQLKDFHFQIIGEGPLAKLMREAPGNVGWVRTVPQQDMTRYYHAADCLLLPSRGEGLPLVVQEVLACGLTAIVSEDEPYARQLAEAQVVRPAPRESPALAAVVRSACESRLDLGWGQRARQYAEQHWDVNCMSSRYVKLMAEFQ